MGNCYSIEVDINPEPSSVIVYELEINQVYNYNIEDPINYIKNYQKPIERIYEDTF